jgi:membrane-associated phospholipid phosphatase
VVFFLAGLLGTSRMILRQHSLLQVVAGFVVGLVCSAIGLVYL